MRISLFVSVLTFCQLVSCNGPIPSLVGRWVEDEPLRTGLNDFLWARGKYQRSLTQDFEVMYLGWT